jgi:hypothetical protein
VGTLTIDKILLEDVVSPEQLNEYYGQEGLADVGAKIDHLIEKTGVMAIRGSKAIKDDEMLSLLEESVYLGHWRHFR